MKKTFKAILAAVNVVIVAVFFLSFTAKEERPQSIVWTTSAFTGYGIESSPLDLARGTEISPAQITSDQADYDPTGWDEANRVRLDGDATFRTILSFAAPDAATSTQWKTLMNVGDYPIHIAGQYETGTTASYRVITPYRGYILPPGGLCDLVYDDTADRWRVQGEMNHRNMKGQGYFTSAGSTTAGDWSDLSFTSSGTSAGITVGTASTTFPQYWQMATGTTNAGFDAIYHSKSMTATYAFGLGFITTTATWHLPAVSDASETFLVHHQLTTQNGTASASSMAANNSCGIRYSHGINGGELEGYSVDNAGSVTTRDLNVAVAFNTTYTTTVEIDKARGKIFFYVNGKAVGQIAATQPSNVVCIPRIGILKTAGTTSRNLNVHDFWSYMIQT